MTRRSRLSALALVSAFLLVSCSDSTPAAITVNGTEVDQATIDAELEALIGYARDHPDLPFADQILGEGSDTVQTVFASQVLTERVISQVVSDEFARRDLRITDEDRQAAEEQFAAQLVTDPEDPESGQRAFDEFPAGFQEYEITFNAQAIALTEDLAGDAGDGEVTDEDVRAYYDENEDQFQQNCVSHILVEDEATATDLRGELEGGAEFATVAEANSTDVGSAANGGELGCQPPGAYVPELEEAVANAELNEVTEPVETEFGFHLILVSDRSAVPFEEAEPQIRAQLEQGAQDPLTTFLQEELTDADVEVNPRYGEWDPEVQAVVPPEGPETPSTTVGTGLPPDTAPPTTGG